MVDRILVPTDGSAQSEQAAQKAIELAGPLQATIHGLSVASASNFEQGRDQIRTDPEEPAAAALTELEQRVRTDDIEFTGGIREGRPHNQILEYADANDIDLIVLGTEGRTGVERVVLGSVAEKTLRNADIPVMTVPASS